MGLKTVVGALWKGIVAHKKAVVIGGVTLKAAGTIAVTAILSCNPKEYQELPPENIEEPVYVIDDAPVIPYETPSHVTQHDPQPFPPQDTVEPSDMVFDSPIGYQTVVPDEHFDDECTGDVCFYAPRPLEEHLPEADNPLCSDVIPYASICETPIPSYDESKERMRSFPSRFRLSEPTPMICDAVGCEPVICPVDTVDYMGLEVMAETPFGKRMQDAVNRYCK